MLNMSYVYTIFNNYAENVLLLNNVNTKIKENLSTSAMGYEMSPTEKGRLRMIYS